MRPGRLVLSVVVVAWSSTLGSAGAQRAAPDTIPRLRPIVMTTLAMIFGMLPIALALGEGGGFRAPMARFVIGGLITSTLLTLVVVPVGYTYSDDFDDFGGWVGRAVPYGRSHRRAVRREREAGRAGERAGALDGRGAR